MFQNVTIGTDNDDKAARGDVEQVVFQEIRRTKIYRMLLRAKSPNQSAALCVEIAIGLQGFTHWKEKRDLDHLIDSQDGWSYFFGIFVLVEK